MSGESGNIRAHAQAGDWGTHNSLNPLHNDMKRLKQIIDAMQPDQVGAAAGVYYAVSNRVESTMQMLYDQAKRLSENWAGDDANAAMQQMQKAYGAAREIYQTSEQTFKALSQYQDKQIGWQHEVDGVMGTVASSDIAHAVSPTGGMMANKASHNMMERIQQETVNANNAFPTGMIANMPEVQTIDEVPPQNPSGRGPTAPGMPDAPGAGPLPGGGVPVRPSDGTGAGHLPNGDQLPSAGGGTDLASYTPPGGGGAGGLGGLGGGFGAGGLGAGGASPGGLGSGPGAGGVVGGFPGAGAAGAGAAGKPGMGGAMGGGMGGMGHGGGGGEEEERERTTWLAEDEDIWGGDDDATPPVIG
jgi:uncharacterized protein YukE